MKKFFYPYHLVTLSPWPLMMSLSLMIMMVGLLKVFCFMNLNLMFLGKLLLLLNMYQWWRDVIRESSYQGFHTNKVYCGIKFGMYLFILSELMFFLSFFWTYFHMFLSPSMELGSFWPPKNLLIFNPYYIPLLNTLLLLSSGVSITWSHYSLMNMNYKQMNYSLLMTVILGILFLFFQFMEYNESFVNMNDSVFGSIFFLATGFHGLHVLIGMLFIYLNYMRLLNFHFSSIHHFSFEGASWYWHFVDVVWLFLYLFIYWLIF